MTRPRPWLAVVLALVYPGLGHVYVRAWGRALLWSGLAIGTALFAIPPEAAEDVGAITNVDSLVAFGEVVRTEISTLGAVTIITVIVFSVADAYVIARETGRGPGRDGVDGEGTAVRECPTCGRELDEELDFCHWCTARLDADDEE